MHTRVRAWARTCVYVCAARKIHPAKWEAGVHVRKICRCPRCGGDHYDFLIVQCVRVCRLTWCVMQNPLDVFMYTEHAKEATVARLAPSGFYCASGNPYIAVHATVPPATRRQAIASAERGVRSIACAVPKCIRVRLVEIATGEHSCVPHFELGLGHRRCGW